MDEIEQPTEINWNTAMSRIDYDKFAAFAVRDIKADMTCEEEEMAISVYIIKEIESQLRRFPTINELLAEIRKFVEECKRRNPNLFEKKDDKEFERSHSYSTDNANT